MKDWDLSKKDLRTLDAAAQAAHARIAQIERDRLMAKLSRLGIFIGAMLALAALAFASISALRWAYSDQPGSAWSLTFAVLGATICAGLALAKAVRTQVERQLKQTAWNDRQANKAKRYARHLQDEIDGRISERAALDESAQILAACGHEQWPAKAPSKRI